MIPYFVKFIIQEKQILDRHKKKCRHYLLTRPIGLILQS